MFAGKTLLEIVTMGGTTMYVLLLCSVLSLGVVIDRLVVFTRAARTRREALMEKVRDEVKRRDIARAAEICREADAPLARVVQAGLERAGKPERAVAGAMERQIAVETEGLERLTAIVATIGNVAVYIGLFGTVLGIIRAFQDISAAGTGGMDVVIGGVAEALLTTAAGLAVAVPSVVLYNWLTRRVERFVDDMELAASETAEMVGR